MALIYQDAYSSILFMLGFGLGTFPTTMLIQFLGKQFNLKKYLKPSFSTGIIAIMAILFIVRGLNLGIPYLSPKIVGDSNGIELNCCEK